MSLQLPKATSTAPVKREVNPLVVSTEQLQQAAQPSPLPPGTKADGSFQFDYERCKQHLESLSEYLEQFAGKKGMNPFMWITKNLQPLYFRMEGIDPITATSVDKHGEEILPERTLQLQNEILALQKEEPSIANLFKKRTIKR